MANEIIYIPYGLDEISQLELQAALANNLPNFVSKYKWLLKPKNRDTFLKIYSDMVNGLTGASNDSGFWSINTSNDMNSYLMSPREKEIAEHAAYYIQLQMAKMTPRKKEEEKKKEDKKSYGNKEFLSGITQYVGLDRFGGQESLRWAQDWLNLDSNTNGIYSTTKRLSELAKYLGLYRDKIKSELDKYDFTKGPYGSYDEFNSRIERAIAALNNPEWNQEDIDSLNRLGLDREAWLATGANTPITITDADGNLRTITREEYNKRQEEQKLQEEKKKLEELTKLEELLKLLVMKNNILKYKYNLMIRANPNNPYLTSQFSRFLSLLDLQDYLENKYIKRDPSFIIKDRNELSGAYRLLFNNKKLTNLSDEEYNRIKEFKKYNLLKENLYKLNKLNNIIYDKSLNQIYILTQNSSNNKSEDVLSKLYKKKYSEYKRHMSDATMMALRKGGQINSSLDKIIEDFIKNNNI